MGRDLSNQPGCPPLSGLRRPVMGSGPFSFRLPEWMGRNSSDHPPPLWKERRAGIGRPAVASSRLGSLVCSSRARTWLAGFPGSPGCCHRCHGPECLLAPERTLRSLGLWLPWPLPLRHLPFGSLRPGWWHSMKERPDGGRLLGLLPWSQAHADRPRSCRCPDCAGEARTRSQALPG